MSEILGSISNGLWLTVGIYHDSVPSETSNEANEGVVNTVRWVHGKAHLAVR